MKLEPVGDSGKTGSGPSVRKWSLYESRTLLVPLQFMWNRNKSILIVSKFGYVGIRCSFVILNMRAASILDFLVFLFSTTDWNVFT